MAVSWNPKKQPQKSSKYSLFQRLYCFCIFCFKCAWSINLAIQMSDLFCIRDEVEKPGGKQVDADVGGLIVGQQHRQGREFIPTQKNLIKKHSTNSVVSSLLFWWKFHFSDKFCVPSSDCEEHIFRIYKFPPRPWSYETMQMYLLLSRKPKPRPILSNKFDDFKNLSYHLAISLQASYFISFVICYDKTK